MEYRKLSDISQPQINTPNLFDNITNPNLNMDPFNLDGDEIQQENQDQLQQQEVNYIPPPTLIKDIIIKNLEEDEITLKEQTIYLNEWKEFNLKDIILNNIAQNIQNKLQNLEHTIFLYHDPLTLQYKTLGTVNNVQNYLINSSILGAHKEIHIETKLSQEFLEKQKQEEIKQQQQLQQQQQLSEKKKRGPKKKIFNNQDQDSNDSENETEQQGTTVNINNNVGIVKQLPPPIEKPKNPETISKNNKIKQEINDLINNSLKNQNKSLQKNIFKKETFLDEQSSFQPIYEAPQNLFNTTNSNNNNKFNNDFSHNFGNNNLDFLGEQNMENYNNIFEDQNELFQADQEIFNTENQNFQSEFLEEPKQIVSQVQQQKSQKVQKNTQQNQTNTNQTQNKPTGKKRGRKPKSKTLTEEQKLQQQQAEEEDLQEKQIFEYLVSQTSKIQSKKIQKKPTNCYQQIAQKTIYLYNQNQPKETVKKVSNLSEMLNFSKLGRGRRKQQLPGDEKVESNMQNLARQQQYKDLSQLIQNDVIIEEDEEYYLKKQQEDEQQQLKEKQLKKQQQQENVDREIAAVLEEEEKNDIKLGPQQVNDCNNLDDEDEDDEENNILDEFQGDIGIQDHEELIELLQKEINSQDIIDADLIEQIEQELIQEEEEELEQLQNVQYQNIQSQEQNQQEDQFISIAL